MQQHLGRLDGVAKVDVSLADGRVVILPKEDGRLDPAQVFKATYDSGVTLAEMKITARGRLKKDPEKGWLFEVSSAQSFPVVPNEVVRSLEEKPDAVVLTGVLYRKPKGKAKPKEMPPLQLEVLSVEKN